MGIKKSFFGGAARWPKLCVLQWTSDHLTTIQPYNHSIPFQFQNTWDPFAVLNLVQLWLRFTSHGRTVACLFAKTLWKKCGSSTSRIPVGFPFGGGWTGGWCSKLWSPWSASWKRRSSPPSDFGENQSGHSAGVPMGSPFVPRYTTTWRPWRFVGLCWTCAVCDLNFFNWDSMNSVTSSNWSSGARPGDQSTF